MVVNGSGHTDWASLAGNAGLQTVVDLPSGKSDNSFGQGTKENDTSVTVVTGSIPPNKNDLTRAYLYNDQASGGSFLYLAWERAVNLGDAHIDFELNQNATSGFDGSTRGPVTLNRTKGDLLISYDFSGNGTPDITLFIWDGTQWTDRQDLSALHFAEAAVNPAALSDVLDNNASVGIGDFGEASVNLSDALVAAGFTPNTCQSYGSVTVKSRASGSSTAAELKDFIAPAPIHVSNCATPSISTTLSRSTGSIGDSVRDSASLTGATATAGGSVTYTVYSDSACTAKVADGGTVTVTNGTVPDSNPVTFNTAGVYYWQAVYSGDPRNNGATSPCTSEELVIGTAISPVTGPVIDLAVAKVGSPNPDKLPGNITWTIVVTNNGPNTATGVTVSDPIPAGNTFVSVTTTQGSCTAGAILSCSLGTIPAGGTVTITLVTKPSRTGKQVNAVTVVGNQPETNYSNNITTATVTVVGPHTPPKVYCIAISKVRPKQLFVGRKTRLTIQVKRHGKPVRGVRVRIKGPKLDVRTNRSNRKGVVKRRVKLKKAGVVVFSPIASRRCNTKRIGVTGVFTPPITG